MVEMIPVNRMLSLESIAAAEKKYNARYVFDTCLKYTKSEGWVNQPAAIFYTELAHPRGSNYFGLYWDFGEGLYIADAFSSIQGQFRGYLFEDGSLVHSRYRHDYFTYRNVMVDGGRDYFRASPCPPGARPVTFSVVDGRLVEASES